MPIKPAKFTYSTALFHETPLLGMNAFLHGEIIEIKKRKGELSIQCKDEKGTWEAYTENIPEKTIKEFKKGKKTRAYGVITSQPDGKNQLHAKWIILTAKEEYEFVQNQTKKEWEKLIQENPTLQKLKKTTEKKENFFKKEETIPKKEKEEKKVDFIPASQLNVEREFI